MTTFTVRDRQPGVLSSPQWTHLIIIMKLPNIIALVALTATAAVALAQEHTLRFGHVVQAGHPISMGVQKFGELLAARSGGRIKVQELGGGTVGGEAQQLSAVQGGVQDITMPSATVMGSTVKEFTLLETFLRHPGQVLSREQLLSHVWGYDFDPGSNVVDVYVGYLRRKLGGAAISTVRGVGYRLDA